MLGKRVLLIALVLMVAASTALFGCTGQDETAAPDKLVLALVPSQNAETLLENAQPLADALSDKIGIPVDVQVPTNYSGVVEGLDAGTVDIAMLNSFGYVLSHQLSETRCILKSVRYGSATYHGQFLVMADSDIEDIADLAGKKIAFTYPTSTSGHIFAMVTLHENGINPETDMETMFAGGHDSAIIALMNGQVDVAVTFDDARTLIEEEFPNVKAETRVLGFTDEIPNDTVSVRADLGDELTEQIKQALLDIASTEEGQEMLYSIYEINGLEPAEDSEYDPVRAAAEELGIDLEEMMGG